MRFIQRGMFISRTGDRLAVLGDKFETGEVVYSEDGKPFHEVKLSGTGGTQAPDGVLILRSFPNPFSGVNKNLQYICVPAAKQCLIICGGVFFVPKRMALPDRSQVIKLP